MFTIIRVFQTLSCLLSNSWVPSQKFLNLKILNGSKYSTESPELNYWGIREFVAELLSICWVSQFMLSTYFSSQVYIREFLTAELLNSNPKCLSNVSISPECGYGVVGIKPEIYGSLKSLMMGFCNNETWPRNEYTQQHGGGIACRKIGTALIAASWGMIQEFYYHAGNCQTLFP